MTARLQTWFRQKWHDLMQADKDANHITEAPFPYHNGVTKVYYTPLEKSDE